MKYKKNLNHHDQSFSTSSSTNLSRFFDSIWGGGEEDIQVIQLDPQEGPQAYLASIRLPQIDFVPARLRP